MDIQMTIVLALVYIVFIAWGNSKKVSGVTSVNATPEPDCGYINYFPEVESDEDEEFILDNSSSSSEENWSMFTEEERVNAIDDRNIDWSMDIESEVIPASVCVMIPDPWTIESELSKSIAEKCYALPVATKVQLALPPAEYDPESQCAEDSLNYDIAQYHLMLSIMNIRQLKAEAKKVKLPRYGKMTKAELLSALKVFNA